MESQAYQSLKQAVYSFSSPPESEWNFLVEQFKYKEFKKGEFLLEEGGNPNHIMFIYKGLVKRYYLTYEGKEYISSFDSEGRIISDFAAYIQNKKSRLYIQAIKDCKIYISELSTGKEIRKGDRAWLEGGRRLAELRFIEKANREYEFLCLSPAERFQNFYDKYSFLAEDLTQRDIASYIGLTPEALSRLKKRQSFGFNQ